MPYFKSNGCEVSQGNSKIGTDTLILNMGSATRCPSKAKGLCKLGRRCYALKAEIMYDNTLPYRDRQADYWLNTSAKKIASALSTIILKLNKKSRVIDYIRFNESGDFWSQADVSKLDKVAGYVRAETGVVVYGYTARKDLNFSKVTSFLVKGSSNGAGNNGETIARHPQIVHDNSAFLRDRNYYNEAGKMYAVCPGNCRICIICKIKNDTNVVFPIH